MSRLVPALFALGIALGRPGALSGQSALDAATLAARVQERFATIRDFSGDFVQTYQGGVLRTKTTERGTVTIKRPGRMRWIYTDPERKEFVSDSVKLYTYLVLDKQVIVGPAPGSQEGDAPALLLAGRTNLSTDFVPTLVELPDAPAGLVGLKLVPKAPDPDYLWLALGVDPRTYQILYLVASDRQEGRSAFRFSNLKENLGLADKDFEFRIPRGVEVMTSSGRDR